MKTHMVRFFFLLALSFAAVLALSNQSPPLGTLAAVEACVPGPHTGTITSDETWCAVDNPHLVEGTVTVAIGVTLTIEPGAVTQAPGYPYDIGIIVQGELEALGTPTQPITLTSTDGGPTWAGLIVDGGSANLAYTTVEYACSDVRKANVAVINGGHLEMTDSTLQECHYGGGAGERTLYIDSSSVSAHNSAFRTSDQYPIYILGASSVVTLTENILEGNAYDRILLAPNAMMEHDTTLTPQAVWDGYQLEGSMTVPPTVTLTLEPGVLVKTPGYPYDIGIIVQGELEALGTPTQPITLTSTDGGPTWAGLIVDGGSANLAYTTVEYACSDVRKANVAVINGGHLEMTDSTLQECHYGGGAGERTLYIDSSSVSAHNSAFRTSDQYPIYILGASSVVTLTENILDENYYDRILLAPNAMMGHDTTLTPQTVWDGYELEGSLTIPSGAILTIDPGVIVRSPEYPYNIGIFVEGHLEAVGTSELPIQFTRVSDDINGWLGIVLNGGTANLKHIIIEKGCGGTLYDRRSNIRVINGGLLEMSDSLMQECTGDGNASLYVENGTATVDSTAFSDSDGEHGYVTGDSTLLISSSSIDGAGRNGLLVEGDLAYVRVTGSTILSNGVWGGDGVRNNGNATVILSGDPDQGNFIAFNQDYGANQAGLTGQIIATYNFWGDPSGPTHAGNPGGTGEPVTDRVLYDPWLTEPPVGTLPADLVQALGPNYVSAGETLNIGYLLNNVFTETLRSVVLVGQLPEEAEYLQSTPDGEYWPGRHQVVWKLGDVTPGEAVYRAVQVRYAWGLAAHLMTYSNGLVAAENLPSDLIDLQEYLTYEEVTVTSFEDLSEQELDNLLAANPDLDALYQDAVSQGFSYYGAARLQHLSDGTDQVNLPMIDVSAPGETIYLTHRVTGSQRLHEYPEAVLGDCPSATYEYDYPTGYLQMWEPFFVGSEETAVLRSDHPLLGCDDFGLDDCLHNCLIQNLYSHQFDQSLSGHCRNCYQHGDDCSLCAMDLSFFHSPEVETIAEQCQDFCGDPGKRDMLKCEEDTRQCVNSHTVLATPCEDCGYDTSQNYFQVCPSGTRCVNGGCRWIRYPETLPLEVLVAGDPNHMEGPESIAPGQTISYTISYENVGEGTAYGVFVESQLPDLFDADTLLIHDGGFFFPSSRILLWDVGELAPGAGGTVSFEVQVPVEALSGTIIIASGTVYFPSVPETTPTGDVVSIVEDVVAYSQQVETIEDVPVPVTLTGYTPSANPLAFTVVVDPLQGELSGVAPNLTYTPRSGFEGVDYFSFLASDGLITSFPATVELVVGTGAESESPIVLYTSPLEGATNVRILDTPVHTDTYEPTIIAWFSEPLDTASVTPDTVFVTNLSGQRIAGTVTFVAGTDRIEFLPSQPLKPGMLYTVTITTGVHDTSGNAMAANYVWSFRTMTGHVNTFLPMVQK